MIQFNLIGTAHRGFLKTYRASLRNYIDPNQVFVDSQPAIKAILNLGVVLRIRFMLCMSILMVKNENQNDERKQTFYFCSNVERLLSSYQISDKIGDSFKKITQSLDAFIRNGSGWTIKQIETLDVHIGKYREMRGGCADVKLPPSLKNKKALLSIQCKNDFCFLYSIIAKLFPKRRNQNRSKQYDKYLKYFKARATDFPMKIKNIPHFEKNNKIRINVYASEKGDIYPIHVSKNNYRNECDLFLYKNHYFLIKSFKRLLSSKTNCRFFCKLCMNGFKRESSLAVHKSLCNKKKPQKTSIPKETIVKFKKLSQMVYHPFTVFADFECILQKISGPMPSLSSTFTGAVENHLPISYAIIVTDASDHAIFHEYYCGKDAVAHFLDTLKKLVRKLITEMKKIIPMGYISKEKLNSDACHICGKKFLSTDVRVRDHNHYISSPNNFRGMSHVACNLNYRATYFIPVIIHNFRNYDSHLILKNMPHEYAKRIQIIPVNLEKFTMCQLDEIRFIDSYQFLNASLDALVNNLKESGHEFKIFDSFFSDTEHSELLKRKGIFPYSYFSSEKILNEKCLPPKNAFYSVLTDTSISDEEYSHAQLVFKALKCKTFGDYLELYQNVDVLMLAEVFLSFRRMSEKYYKLDPVFFITGAELTWNAGLRYSKVELQLLTNVTDYLWIETGMRGGICFLGTRYVEANNPLIPETYDPMLKHNYILALDVSNLYGYIMSQSLPTGNFSWLTESEIANFNILQTKSTSDVGFILETDLIYPSTFHDFHNDMPLAVEHLDIHYNMLSPYAKELCDNFNLKSTLPCKKLVPNFYKKCNYITHYLNLKFYVQQGLIIDKIHRILAFSQRPFLKEYIEFNNDKRAETNSVFEKSFFKRMNNAFFGKCCQNVHKRMSVKASLNETDCQKHLANPLLEDFSIINDNFSIFKMKKANLVLNKPIYVGFSVLDLSKLHMYRLFYKYFKAFYNDRCSLIYIDTDSLYINIETDDLYHDLNSNFRSILDCSNYPRDHPLFNETNKAKLGYLKSESIAPIRAFAGLKAKMYTYICADETHKKTAKGVKKSSLKNVTFETYKEVLSNKSCLRQSQYSIVSKNHSLKTVIQNKVGLSAYYDKKFLKDDGLTSNSYGHFENDMLSR